MTYRIECPDCGFEFPVDVYCDTELGGNAINDGESIECPGCGYEFDDGDIEWAESKLDRDEAGYYDD